MLTPRSSRTSPCWRPEASTRNDSRRLSAICEKSTFLQYLMEEIAPSGPLEDQRIMSRRTSRLLGGLATGSPRAVLGRQPSAWSRYRSAAPGAARSVRCAGWRGLPAPSVCAGAGRWSPRPETWVTRSRSQSVRVRRPGSGRGRRRPPSGNRLRASHRARRRCGLRSSLFLEVVRFLRELD